MTELKPPRAGAVAVAAALATFPCAAIASEAYPDPAGGWTYIYDGDQLMTDEPALDGTWTHNNNSDAFRGDEIGGVLDPATEFDNAPGGAMIITEGESTFIRMQDTGDPRDYDGGDATWDDPSNRKIYFGHYLFNDIDFERADTILDNGVTLTFRARIPTPSKASGPLDPLHRDGQSSGGTYPDNGVVPYPEGGDGYVTSDGAKGNFVIRQFGDGSAEHPGGAIAISLTVADDTPGGNPNSGKANYTGLTLNERSGPNPSGNVDFGEGSGENNIALDPTDWHEFWICIRKTRDPQKSDATHDVIVFRDGELVSTVRKVTAGTGSDLNEGSFIATGASATPQNWALDVDWFGYKDEFVLPEGGSVPPDVIVTPVGGTLFHDAGDGLEIEAVALTTIPASGFEVVLNGEDITSMLTIGGTDADDTRTATYAGIEPNRQYLAEVRVTDSAGVMTEVVSAFDTFNDTGSLTVESEDYNHTGGNFADDPAPGDSFFWIGTEGIDYFDTTPDTFNDYRFDDTVEMGNNNDFLRPKHVDAGWEDWQITGIEVGEWWNYTRTFPDQTFTPYLRAGAGAPGVFLLEEVTGDRTMPGQTTSPLGRFEVAQTRTVSTYGYTPLTDALGVPRVLNLMGETTVRLAADQVDNDINHNFLFFADAEGAAPDPGWAQAASPDPGAEDVPVDSVVMVSLVDGATPLDPGGFGMTFNGSDVTGSLAVTDTDAGADVSYDPGGMAGNSTQTVELTYRDTGGASATRTWSFQTGEGGGDPTPTQIAIRREGANVVIEWSPAGGTLAESTDMESWAPVDGATSPATRPIEGAVKGFRVER